MRQKLHRGRRNVFRKRNPALRVFIGVATAVAVVAVGFFGAKWFSEHPIVSPDTSVAEPTESAPKSEADTSVAEPENSDSVPQTPATVTDQVRGFYLPFSELSVDSLTDTSLFADARAAGFNAVVFDLKDAEGQLYYRFSCDIAQQVNSYVENALSAEQFSSLVALIREAGLMPIPRLYAFKDNLGAKVLSAARIGHQSNAGWVWYDAKPQNGGKAWLNPYSDEAHRYIIDLATELKSAGAAAVILDGVCFPNQVGSANFGTSHADLKQDEVLSLFVEKAISALGDCPVILSCSAESALGTATQIYGGNPLTFAPTMAAPMVFPGSLPERIKVGETVVQNTPDTLKETVQTLVSHMILRTKVLEQAPVITPFLQTDGYTAAQIRLEMEGCLAAGADSYILYSATGSYDFAAY